MGRYLTIPAANANAAPSSPLLTPAPLPLVAVYSCYQNNPDCSIYDSDFNLVSRMTQASSGHAWPTSGEIWNAYSGWFDTHSTVSSNGPTTSWVKATPCYSADGHQLLRVSPNGGLSARRPDTMANFMTDFGVVVMPRGVRQPMSLWCNGTSLRQYLRGSLLQVDTLTTGLSNATASQWAGSGASGNGRGMVGYHADAGLLVVIEPRSTGCEYRAHIWQHPTAKLTGKPGELNRFVLEARAGTNGASYRFIDFAWNANSASSYAESQYRMRVVPTTSGKIALVRFVPHTIVHMAVLTPGTGNTGTLDTNFQTVGCTTSYGVEQGTPYGMRHQITWDNQWVAAFAPYYYYGSGLSGIVVNTSDPARYYRLSFTSTSCGMSLVPLRESGFAYAFHHSNADGNAGLNAGYIDLGSEGFQVNGTASPGASLSLPSSTGWLDTGYTSTNYPCLLPVENWTI